MSALPKRDRLVEAVRIAAAENCCRLEVASDERLPVSASNPDRTHYGFGATVEEAVYNLRHNPRLAPVALVAKAEKR